MGTTLTGTTPQDTYDSLIKVTDNGPISGTAKFLSDGLGNDSVLALSTSLVGIGTAVPTSKLHIAAPDALSSWDSALPFVNVTNLDQTNGQGFALLARGGALDPNCNIFEVQDYSANSKFVVKGLGNVGIGTTAPIEKATINGLTAINGASVTAFFVGNNNSAFVDFATNQTRIGAQVSSGASTIAFLTASAGYTTIAERARITSDGLTFNGDTAAANALDDYEEGTFTATLKGITDPTTPVTTTGTYTKIGRQVTVRGAFVNVNTTGATGDVVVAGMPFTNAAFAVGSVMIFNFDLDTSTAQNSYLGASTTLEFYGQKDDAAWVSLKHNAGTGRYLNFTLTYFV